MCIFLSRRPKVFVALEEPVRWLFGGALFEMQSGLMDDGAKLGLLGSWMALFVIFAGRKFTQPIKVMFEQMIIL